MRSTTQGQEHAWKLFVSGAGKHTYLIKGSSKTNVDFEYFFVMIPTSGRSRKPIPISHPLLGVCYLVCFILGNQER